jgi:putative transcriptional regulator
MKNRIRIERAILGITQDEMARRLGISRQSVHAIENGKFVPSTVLALKIAALFAKRVEDIFELEEGD